MVRQCCLVVHRSSVWSCIARLSFVCRYSARDMGARASDRVSGCASLVRLIVCLIIRLIVRLIIRLIVRLIIRLIVHRSSACSSCGRCPVVGLSLTCLFVSRLLLVCVLIHRSSATRQSARPSLVRRCPVSSGHGRCSVRLLLVAALSLLCRSSVVGQGRSSVSTCIIGLSVPLPLLYSAALPLGCSATLLGCSTARLLGCSTRLLYRSTRLLGCSTRLLYSAALPLYCSAARLLYSATLLGCSVTPLAALRAFLFSLLVEFGRHAVHTHSVPRVVSRHSVITHSLFHGCSHCRCLLSSSA